MVLKWLGGGKPDHPLADDKGVKEVLGALPLSDPFATVEELREWVRSTSAAEGFRPERRAEVLRQLEDALQPHLRRLARDYAANPRLPKTQETRLWNALSGASKDLGSAWAQFVAQAAADAGRLKAVLPLVLVRGVQAIGAQLKWRYMHYEQAAEDTWRELGTLHRFADEKKLLREAAPVGATGAATTTVERELAKLLMLAASSPDSLLPADIELVERIVAHFAADFVVGNAPQPQVTHHCVDLESGRPPWRMAETPAPSPSLRYFSAGAAAEKLEEFLRIAERGGIPSDLALGADADVARVRNVLRHLRGCWSSRPPVRQHERYPVKHRITVVNGFAGLLAYLKDPSAAGAMPESWVTENISAGGIGAVLDTTKSDWLRIGRLVGVQVEGGSGSCAGGVIRRCWRPKAAQMNVGIRTYAKEVFAVKVSKLGIDEALLLNDGRTLGAETLLCLPEGSYSAQISPTIEFDGNPYLLLPVELVDAGDDFELARFRVMQQG